MNLRSEIIQRWWPTTQSLDLVEGPVEKVAAALYEEVSRYVRGEAVSTWWEEFPDLDSAFRIALVFTNVPTIFLVLPTHSKWSVLWNNSFLCNGYDSLCSNLTKIHGFVTIHWSAHDTWTSSQSGASFIHRRRFGGDVITRTVHAGQTDKRWDFCATGEPLPEEELEGYNVRRKRDRFNEERVSALLSRLGAAPWAEQFYAVPGTHTFVLRRENLPSTITRRFPGEVIRAVPIA
jgi:hypothetical protein